MHVGVRLVMNLFKYKRKLHLFIKPTIKQFRYLCTEVKSENNGKQLKILFFGTDNFSLPSLQELHKQMQLSTLGVVTSFKDPANCVRIYAEQHKIPLEPWPVDSAYCQKYDLGVVVSFGHLLPENIIKSFPLGMINVHASLLPRWRGAAPIMYALMHGDKETGVSIMRIEPKRFDVGDILAQHRVSIAPNTFMPELHARLANDGASLLNKVIREYPASFRNATKQNDAAVTLAPRITRGLTELCWSNMSATDIYNRFRALYGFKLLSTKFQGKTVYLTELKLPDASDADVNLKSTDIPGCFSYKRNKKCLRVCCADQSYIEVHKLRVEGKKAMSASDFNNGFLKNLSTQDLLFIVK